MSITCHSLKERRCKSWAQDSPQAKQAETVAPSRGELLGMGHSGGPTAQDRETNQGEQLGPWAGPHLSRPELAQHSVLFLL